MKLYVGTICVGEYGDQEIEIKYVGESFTKCLNKLRKEKDYIYSHVEIWENEELLEKLYKHKYDANWVKEK